MSINRKHTYHQKYVPRFASRERQRILLCLRVATFKSERHYSLKICSNQC